MRQLYGTKNASQVFPRQENRIGFKQSSVYQFVTSSHRHALQTRANTARHTMNLRKPSKVTLNQEA